MISLRPAGGAARRAPFPLFFALFAALATLATAARAEGYCRKTTESPEDPSYDPSLTGSCGDGAGAKPLYWPNAVCLEYRVVVDEDVTGLSVARARALTKRAAAAWTDASCARVQGPGTPSVHLVDADEGRCLVGPKDVKVPSEVHFRSVGSKEQQQLALTTLSKYRSGIIDEGRVDVFASAYGEGGDAEAMDERLGYIVRHELGHLLGLAHSEHTDAVMFGSYDGGPAVLSLTQDDVAGICKAYPPDAPMDDAGCAVAGRAGSPHRGAPGSALAGGACVALLLARGRRYAPRRHDRRSAPSLRPPA